MSAKNILATLFVTLWISLFPVLAAIAHGVELIRTEPSAGEVLFLSPAIVQAWFSEELDTGDSTIGVYDGEGKQVDLHDGGVDLNDPQHASLVVSLPELPGGGYTVRWKAMLLDGDTSTGEFNFFVGKAGAATATASVSAVISAASVQSSPSESQPQLVTPTFVLILAGLGGLLVGIVLLALLRGRRHKNPSSQTR